MANRQSAFGYTNEKTSFSSLVRTGSSSEAGILKAIIGKELAYYHSLVSPVSIRHGPVTGFFDAKLFVMTNPMMFMQTVQERAIDADKKSQFIENDLPNMIQEYQLFMLNLADQIKNEQIKNSHELNELLKSFKLPISIQLLWRCHILHPAIYYQDCMKHLGFILSPNIDNEVNLITASKDDNTLFALKQYVKPTGGCSGIASREYIEWTKKWKKSIIYDKDNKFTDLDFNVTVMKQMEFLSKSHCIVWEDNLMQHLDKYIKQYIRFLQTGAKLLMGNKNMNRFEYDALSPTFTIDLLWHTHMMYPHLYRTDCKQITNGFILDHDDISVGLDDNDQDDNYWKYGRLGQFNQKHFVNVVMRDKYELIIGGFIRNYSQRNKQMIPNDIVNMIFASYFNVEDIIQKELSPEPPRISKGIAECKGGPHCCVGDHINFGP